VETAEGFFPMFFLVLWAITSGSSKVVSSDSWLVYSIWFPLSTGQMAIGTCGSSLPVCAEWSHLLWFLPGGSCIALPLQLCEASSSHSKVGQSVLSTTLSPMRLTQLPTTPPLWEVGLLPHPCSQHLLLARLSLLRVQLLWEVGLSPHPCFPVLIPCHTFAFPSWEFGSLPHPIFPRLVQHSTPPPLSVVDYNSLFMFLSFVLGWGCNLPRGCTGLCSQGMSGGVTCSAWCLPVGSTDLCRQL
jgi:hypothetical protein